MWISHCDLEDKRYVPDYFLILRYRLLKLRTGEKLELTTLFLDTSVNDITSSFQFIFKDHHDNYFIIHKPKVNYQLHIYFN